MAVCPAAATSPPEGSDPKLGRFTMVLPPLMSTPRTAGAPAGAFPAPPGPAAGEMPPPEFGSEPCPASALPAPGPAPFSPLPGALPRPMLAPPPAPPRPGLSPPEGEIAREPFPPLLGKPTLGPGWLEITAPELAPLPPLLGGARLAPASSGAPRPVPLRPRPKPELAEPPPTAGGGGTMLLASNVPDGTPWPPAMLPVPPPPPDNEGGGGTTAGAGAGAARVRLPMLPEAAVEGGGATTFGPSDVPAPLRVPRGTALALTAGGGATTLVASEVPASSRGRLAGTEGGGGTTSVGPKSLPIRLLMNDPPTGWLGGGGTTAFDESGTLPLEGRRMSCVTSAEGGGAITDGAGKFNFEFRVVARSGADTGGGITAGLVIRTGGLEISRLSPPGAGGITLPASAGVERA